MRNWHVNIWISLLLNWVILKFLKLLLIGSRDLPHTNLKNWQRSFGVISWRIYQKDFTLVADFMTLPYINLLQDPSVSTKSTIDAMAIGSNPLWVSFFLPSWLFKGSCTLRFFLSYCRISAFCIIYNYEDFIQKSCISNIGLEYAPDLFHWKRF